MNSKSENKRKLTALDGSKRKRRLRGNSRKKMKTRRKAAQVLMGFGTQTLMLLGV